MQPSSSKAQAGITVIELMFALAIAAILFGFASNSASAVISAARTSSGLSSLLTALTTGRNTASNTEKDVVLCPSTDGETCADSDHWEHGWIAFQALHPGSDRQADDPIVLRQGSLPSKVHLVSSKGRTRIRFQASGSSAGSNATFTFCDARGARAATAYAMSNPGNLRAVPPDPTYTTEACASL
jgi:type IV fimbrial biogenesis protein FimT